MDVRAIPLFWERGLTFAEAHPWPVAIVLAVIMVGIIAAVQREES